MSSIRSIFLLFLVTFAVSLSSTVFAADSDKVQKQLTNKVNDLTQELESIRANKDSLTDQQIRNKIETQAERVFAIRRMAGRVMGQHAQYADKQQRDRFVREFKDNLFDSYLETLLNAEGVSIELTQTTLSGNGKGKVNAVIRDSQGESYQTVFSIFQNDNGWFAENIIIEGVNVGLTLRNSFNESMEKQMGNVDKAIDNWNIDDAEDIE